MYLPQSHHHPDPLNSLAPHLLLHLPYSLPILRIIQHAAFNPDARIFSTLKPDDNADPHQAWAAVYVERSRFPDTECWLFSTFETWVNRRSEGSTGSVDSDANGEIGRREIEARVQMLSVLNDVAIHSSSLQTAFLPTTNTPLILGTLNDALLPLLAGTEFPTLKPVEFLTREVVNVVVDGRPAQKGTLSPLTPSSSSSSCSIPTTTTTTSTSNSANDGLGDGGGVILGYCKPIHKFLIPPPSPSPSAPSTTTTTTIGAPSLPNRRYTFTTRIHQPHDLALAVSRSEVPRTASGLGRLGGVGVRFHRRRAASSPSSSSSSSEVKEGPSSSSSSAEEAKEEGRGELVAWLFLSPDGSLQSLHVEPEHRGRGVAKALCRRLIDRLRSGPEEMGVRRLPPQSRGGCSLGQQVGGSDGMGMIKGILGDDDDDGIAAAMKEVGAEGWAHSDVLEHNADGGGVARGIGGKAGWRVRWVGVDLERVRRVFASLSA